MRIFAYGLAMLSTLVGMFLLVENWGEARVITLVVDAALMLAGVAVLAAVI